MLSTYHSRWPYLQNLLNASSVAGVLSQKYPIYLIFGKYLHLTDIDDADGHAPVRSQLWPFWGHRTTTLMTLLHKDGGRHF